MKIAILSRVLFLSGVTTHIIDLTGELVKRGHKVYIFTAGIAHPEKIENRDLEERLIKIGAEIVNVHFPHNHKNKIKYGLQLLSTIPRLRFLFKSKEIEVVHVHTPSLSLLIKMSGRRFVKTVHVKDLSLSILNCKATHEITISRETYKEAREKFKYKEDEISLIFNGVNKRFARLIKEEDKYQIKEAFKLPEDRIMIGIVGSIQRRKGHDILIKALGRVKVSLRDKFHLVILGDGGVKAEEWIRQLIVQNGMVGSVSKFGFQDPKPFYDLMDIFVLPSRLEGFGLVVVEAALSGCCVVRSDTEGAYDQINDGETGFLFENEKVDQLTIILEQLMEDHELRKSVAGKGRDFALEHFTSDKMAEKTLAVYEKVING